MSLHLHVGEAQRIVAQLEESVTEAPEYSELDRARIGAALSDLAARLELVRIAVLEEDPERGPEG